MWYCSIPPCDFFWDQFMFINCDGQWSVSESLNRKNFWTFYSKKCYRTLVCDLYVRVFNSVKSIVWNDCVVATEIHIIFHWHTYLTVVRIVHHKFVLFAHCCDEISYNFSLSSRTMHSNSSAVQHAILSTWCACACAHLTTRLTNWIK